MNIFTVFRNIYFFHPVLDGYAHFIYSPDITSQVDLDILCRGPTDKG